MSKVLDPNQDLKINGALVSMLKRSGFKVKSFKATKKGYNEIWSGKFKTKNAILPMSVNKYGDVFYQDTNIGRIDKSSKIIDWMKAIKRNNKWAESVNEDLNSKGFSIINQSMKTMAINFRDLQKLVKKQDDSRMWNEVDNIRYDLNRIEKVLKNKTYNESVNEAVNPKDVESYVKKKGLKGVDLPFWKVGIDYPFYPTKFHYVRGATAKEAEKKLSTLYHRESGGKIGKAKFDDDRFLKVHKNLKESVNEADRDYKDEYKKFQSSTKSKKYRAELNKYNRKKGTYGNGDGKDASHKGGKIVGFESQSKNRGRAEKSRLKKEARTINVEPNWEGLYRFMMHMKTTDKSAFSRVTNKMGPEWKKIVAMAEKNKWTESTSEGFADKLTKKLKKHKGTKVKKESIDEAKYKQTYKSITARDKDSRRIWGSQIGHPRVTVRSWSEVGKTGRMKTAYIEVDGDKAWVDAYKKIAFSGKGNFGDVIKAVRKQNEGFGGELKGADKKKFEKARKENAEQLGYTLTGKSDVNESHHWSIEPSGIMAKINKIVQDKQAMKIGGVLMDMFSASIMMQIYDKVNDKSKEQMNKGNIRQVQVILHKVMKQNKVKV